MESKPSAGKGRRRKNSATDASMHQLYSLGQDHESLILLLQIQTS